jgi:hypothetical protein
VGSNMCNKTCTDSVGLPCHSTSRRILFPKGSSGHPDICSIFPLVQARAPQGLASRVMEDEIALQAAEEATCVARVQALRVKLAAAAQLKSATLDAATAQPMPVPQVSATAQHKLVPSEKEVSWCPQEAVCWSKTLNAEMKDTPAILIPPAAVKRGSAFHNAKISLRSSLPNCKNRSGLLRPLVLSPCPCATRRRWWSCYRPKLWQLLWQPHQTLVVFPPPVLGRRSRRTLETLSRAASSLTSGLSGKIHGFGGVL